MTEDKIGNIKNLTKKVEGRIAPEEAELLYRLAKQCEGEGEIVEIGSYQGYSTIWLASGSKETNRGKVYAIDPHNMSDHGCNEAIFRKNIYDAGLNDYVIPVIATSTDAENAWNRAIKLLFIDGAHDYENARNDFMLWGKHLIQGGIIAFHDYLSLSCPGVTKVVKEHIFDSDNYMVIGCVNTVIYARKVDNLSTEEKSTKESIFKGLTPRFRMENSFQRAQALIKESRDDEAISLLQECENGIRTFFSPMYRMIRLSAIACMYQKIGKQDETERLYKEISAFEDAPFIEKLNSLLNLGNIYLSQKKHQAAAEKFREALTFEMISEKNKVSALRGLGRCHFFMNDYQGARERFREALTIGGISERERYEALNDLGRCHFFMNDYREARERFREALTIVGISEKERYEAFNSLGRCNFSMKQYREAESMFRKASAADGISDIKKFHALAGAARCCAALQRYSDAEKVYSEALYINGVDSENRLIAVLGLGKCHHEQGKYGEEENEYLKVLSDEGVRDISGIWKYRLFNRLGNIYFNDGRLEEAERRFQDALSLENIPGNDRYHAVVGLGRCYFISGKYEKAEALYEEAIGCDGISDEARIIIANAYADSCLAQGKFERIEDICGKVLSLEGIATQKKRDFITGIKKKINSLVGRYGAVNA
jgi:tetratricopeptide (TPR) repeat protein